MQPEAVYAGATQPPRGTASRVRRVGFIIVALLVYRMGTFIPLPGIDWVSVSGLFSGLFNSNGALTRVSVLALGLLPYITASIFIQLSIWLVPGLGRKTESRAGREQIGLYTRLLTVLVAALQANAMAAGLRHHMLDTSAVNQLAIAAALTAGTMFLVWLSDRITRQGLGNGVLLILSADIVANIPSSAVAIRSYIQLRNIPTLEVIALGGLMFAVLAGLVFVELAQRRIPVVYQRLREGNRSYVPLKLNGAGVLPLLFAPWFLALVPYFVLSHGLGPEWLKELAQLLVPYQPLHVAVAAAGIVFFTFYFAPDLRVAAEKLERSGGFIPGIQPGRETADHIAYVQTRITAIGAAYLTAVYVLPVTLLQGFRELPFYLSGFMLLAVVIASLDILRGLRRAG